MAELPRTKWDYIYYAMILVTFLGFGTALVGFVGEQLGWWNDVGELMMQAGTVTGLLVGGATLLVGSSRSQVRSTTEAVRENGETLEKIEGELESIDGNLHEQTQVLGEIRDLI